MPLSKIELVLLALVLICCVVLSKLFIFSDIVGICYSSVWSFWYLYVIAVIVCLFQSV